MQKDIIEKITKAPRRPGIYQYVNSAQTVLYVGKALSLRDRLNSYLNKDVTPKTALMLSQATNVNWIETGSEFEALVLEANLIKHYQPKFNVIFRDDKSYLYIFISTGEEFPKIFVIRKNDLFKSLDHKNQSEFNGLKGVYFGPYPSAKIVREVLKRLRRIFPFCQQNTITKRVCFYSHLNLCNPCPSLIVNSPNRKALTSLYRRNIFAIKNILNGRISTVVKNLEKKMIIASKSEDFEQAQLLRDQLIRVTGLVEPKINTKSFLENANFYFEEQKKATDELKQTLIPYYQNLHDLVKIECYDISNIQGKDAVGAQITFQDGIPDKDQYRRCKIRKGDRPNDFLMLTEVLKRRLKHVEWKYPDLIIVDGGKPQVSTITQVLKEIGLNIPLIGLAKRLEEIIILKDNQFFSLRLPRSSITIKLLKEIRDETHRFAITYHRKQRAQFFAKL